MQGIITVGLGFGDEGKGTCVDYLAYENQADLVIRYNGGHQAAHNVVLEDGQHHTFSQFGAASFLNIPTYLGHNVIIEPLAITKEAKHLEQLGITNPFELLTVDPLCLVTTPFHRMLNQIKELSRKEKHGSCGIGVGETRKYFLEHGREALIAKDWLGSPLDRMDKIELLRQRALLEAQSYCRSTEIEGLIEYVYDIDLAAWDKRVQGSLPKVAPIECFSSAKTIVFEGAQGVLLDEYWGFHPHTTWSTTTTRHAIELCDRIGIPRENMETVGIIRSYHTRHGNGPFPTEAKFAPKKDVEHNTYGPWQGNFKVGYFDLPLFKYALEIQPVDSVFLTHIDCDPEIVCLEYLNGQNLGRPRMSLERNEELGKKMLEFRPKELAKAFACDTIEASGVRVGRISIGNKRKDKRKNGV